MINVALFGFGRIGQMHAENLSKNNEIRLIYVHEKVHKLSAKAKKMYNCKVEKNYKKIFKDKNVDIIFISSPTNTHIKFIEEGVKNKVGYWHATPYAKDVLSNFYSSLQINH